ncbi:squalene--hopene cyclase, partial [Candidatus Sumerlaeota bacterium]|nr:squalene--hopene cyclase [Candidatus Sumerlaeota bacterium]
WLRAAAGSLEPERLAKAIADVYGKDRTFSVPILTMCALAGRLGPAREAWKLVSPLPFEVAAFPRQWLKHLRLPVVSYALPALIAIGQAIHYHRPSGVPPVRWMRELTRARTLEVLREIQPASGGFLEAAPLTSFVTMSLASIGQADHPAARKGVEFLSSNVRPDGSWPIDTNLATWTTTLAINALAESGELTAFMSAEEVSNIREWVLNQQYSDVHPFTNADPGGWAWTDLSGGVPDADDTPGALLAIRKFSPFDERVREAGAAGVKWLLDLQNRDGGIPTFCKGWGALPFDRSGADLTAHALRAFAAWRGDLPEELRPRVDRATSRMIEYLKGRQHPSGYWLPLWFGNENSARFENPVYGTSRVLLALSSLTPTLNPLISSASAFLLSAQNSDGGWGGAAGVTSSVEETALALEGLCAVAIYLNQPELRGPISRGAMWLAEAVESGRFADPSPIGFYFANLWYFEKLYPLVFTVSALAKAIKVIRGM